MAKSKGKGKSKKKKPSSLASKSPFEQRRAPPHAGVSDLRLVRQHMDAYRDGESAALDVLTSLGRDACVPVLAYAEELGDEELLEFARRLVAVPPAIESNLFALREAAVDTLVDEYEDAPNLRSERTFAARGSLALFDPQQVRRFLARGGRARKEASEEHKGTLAIFGLGVADAVQVRVRPHPAPEGTPVMSRRLRVGSGVVAAGLPEASDGPRLGAVRLDPDRTALHDAADAEQVQFFKLANGVFRVDAVHSSADVLDLYVYSDANPEEKLPDSPGGVPLSF